MFGPMCATACVLDANTSQITYLEEYYLTNDEIQVLRTSSAQIAKEVPDGCMLIELGSGYVLPQPPDGKCRPLPQH